MFVITNKEISDQLYETSWERDCNHYCNVMRAIAAGNEPAKNDRLRAEKFAEIMDQGIEISKTHENLTDYYAIRQRLTETKLTPEDIDYSIAGNVLTKKINACDNIDFNVISSMGYIPKITKIVSQAPHTVIYFNDGDKVKVTCQPDETFDAEKGIYICLLKKAIGPKNLRHLFSLMENARCVTVRDRSKKSETNACDNMHDSHEYCTEDCESCDICTDDCETCRQSALNNSSCDML